MLNFSPSQRFIANEVEVALSDRFHTSVKIDGIDIGLFNRIIIHGLDIKDQSNKPLLSCNLATVKIELKPLLWGEVSLRTISLLDGNINLYKAKKDSPTNFQFILDALKSKEEKKTSSLNLRINSLILRRINIEWHELYKRQTLGTFNLSHLSVSNISTNISLKRLTTDSINFRVRSLSFQEKSGLNVEKLTLRLVANTQHADLSDFDLHLPHSFLNQNHIAASYNGASPQTIGNTLTFKGRINKAFLSTEDFAFIVPQLRGLKETVFLQTDYSVSNNKLHFNKTYISTQSKQLKLSSSILLGRTNGRISSMWLDIRDLHLSQTLGSKIFEHFNKKSLPQIIQNFGDISYKGVARIKLGQYYAAKGVLNTKIGNFEENILYQHKRLSGYINGKNFTLSELLNDAKLPSSINFHLEGTSILDNRSPKVEANLTLKNFIYNKYLYHNIAGQFHLCNSEFRLNIASLDPNAILTGNLAGKITGTTPYDFRIFANIKKLTPANLHLTNYFGPANISANIEGRLKDFNHKKPIAQLVVRDFSMASVDSTYKCNNLNLATTPLSLHLKSDFADAEIQGPIDLIQLKQTIMNILFRSLPGLRTSQIPERGHQWFFQVQLKRADILRRLLKLPVYMYGPSTLKGYINYKGLNTSVVFDSNDISYDRSNFKDISIYVNGSGEKMKVLLQGKKTFKDTSVQFALTGRTENGALVTDLKWDDENSHKIAGNLYFTTAFSKAGQFIDVRIHPTNFNIGDSIWAIDRGHIVYDKKKLEIENFSIMHGGQKLNVFGKLSSNPEDSISAHLQKIDIAYVLNLVDFHAVEFTGKATGTASISQADKGNKLSVNLHIPTFHFNNGLLGHLHLLGNFDFSNKQINLDGHITEGDSATTDVVGFVNLQHKRLQLDINSKKTNLSFLQHYVDGIFGNLEGRATGYCRIFGPLKQLNFEGNENAWAKAKVLSTGTTYFVNKGHVTMQPGIFSFNNFSVTDNKGGEGIVCGMLQHDHLKNLRYNFDVNTHRLLIYNQPASLDLPFYSTAIGTGHMSLKGSPGNLYIDMNMRPEKGSTLTYTVNRPDDYTNVPFIRFNKKSERTLSKVQENEQTSMRNGKDSIEESSTNIHMNMLFDVTPAAAIKIIMDEKTGDVIDVHGSGPIRINYYNKGNFNMFGTYTVNDGTYKMSIQNVIRKDFLFTPGSKIIFNGNPFEGELNMQAIYVVNSASLADLNIGNNFSTNTTRVNCLLNFRGKVQNPEVNFDLDLPNVNEDEKQMVRHLISTDEDMNMQIIYLLGVGRFYAPNYSQMPSTGNETQTSAAMKSFLSSTLSNQFNNIISNAMNSSNWTFGANLSTGTLGSNAMEVEGLLSGRLLNNRLLINGNFGYRDNTYNTTNFVGDFDVQYLLTKGGSISLKAYNETNDRYFTRSTLTTQGIGILLKRDFNNIGELFRWTRRSKSLQRKK